MNIQTANCELNWDVVIPKSIESTQRWVLTAMQSHGRELITMLWRILGNEQDVCDAYQDTFLNLAHYNRDKKPENIKAYIFRTANNTAISILRRKNAQVKLSQQVSFETKESTSTDEFDSRLLQENLRQCIFELPEHLRNVIILRDLGELSYLQIGTILKIKSSTARVYRCDAIKLLALRMNR